MAAIELDDIDRALLRELVADGRATLAHLASTAGLSVSAVQSRVRRLEARGVISGYTARVAPDALGQQLSAFVAITPLDPSEPEVLKACVRRNGPITLEDAFLHITGNSFSSDPGILTHEDFYG